MKAMMTLLTVRIIILKTSTCILSRNILHLPFYKSIGYSSNAWRGIMANSLKTHSPMSSLVWTEIICCWYVDSCVPSVHDDSMIFLWLLNICAVKLIFISRNNTLNHRLDIDSDARLDFTLKFVLRGFEC